MLYISLVLLPSPKQAHSRRLTGRSSGWSQTQTDFQLD